MKKVLLLTLGLVGVFTVSALIHLPAPLVVQYAPLPKGLSLTGVQGTIWNGSAENVRWQRQNLGQVHWQLQASELLSAKAQAQVRFGRGSELQLSGRGVVGYAMSGPYAENLIASIPAEQVIEYMPRLPVPLDITGQVELSIKSLAYEPPFCQSGEGSVVWNTDEIGTPLDALKVGPVVANFSCANSTITLKGDQRSQQVESQAEVVLKPNRSYQSSAWFKPGEQFPPAFRDQLGWLPKPDGQGRYRFTYNGRL